MTNLTYDQNNDIICLKRSGDVDVSEMLEVINIIDSKYNHILKLKVLDDVRDSELKLDHSSDSRDIVKAIKSKLDKYNQVKAAIVARTPMQTVKSMLFAALANLLTKYKVKVFSSKDAANHWLLH